MVFKRSFIILNIFLILSIINESECSSIGLGDQMKKMIEDFQKRMCNPIPSFGLPVLDPFENDSFSFNLTEKRLGHIEGDLWRIKISNLSNFIIHKMVLDLLLRFDFIISIPQIDLKSAYKAKGIISDLFPIDGSGLFIIQVYNTTLSVQGAIKSTNGEVYLKDLVITPKISKLSGTIGNLTPSKEMNELLDNFLNEKGPEMIDAFWHDYEILIAKTISDFSKGFKLGDITDKIISGKPIFPETDPPPTCKDKETRTIN